MSKLQRPPFAMRKWKWHNKTEVTYFPAKVGKSWLQKIIVREIRCSKSRLFHHQQDKYIQSSVEL